MANWGDEYRTLEALALREADGHMLLETRYAFAGLGERRALRIRSDTTAVLAGMGRGLGETVTLAPGATPRLRWSGLELVRRS